MVSQTWAIVLNQSFQNLVQGLVSFIPTLLGAIIILALGCFVGVVLGRLVKQLVDTLKIDGVLRSAGLESIFSRSGFELSVGKLLGGLVKWFFVILSLVTALEMLKLTVVTKLLTDILTLLLPNVITATLVLLGASVIAQAAERVVVGSAKAASLSSVVIIGKITRYSIWIVAILIALSQLGIGKEFMQTLFMGAVVAVSLALGLAFGLGGQGAAARCIDKLHADIKD